jgi:hypothetical protein
MNRSRPYPVAPEIRQKRHIAALIGMLRQFLHCMRRSETANGMDMHAQYLEIGHNMVSAIVEQEYILQTQYGGFNDVNMEHRRYRYYQHPHFNLLNLQESLTERNLIRQVLT